MRLRIIISSLFVIVFGFLSAQNQINWTSFDDINDSLRKEAKPVLIFIHTDWCKYCKMQENTTFKDVEVIQELNDTYYCIQLNAEVSDSIFFLGRTYYKSPNSYHELAIFLGKDEGKLSFPTTVILDASLQLMNRIIGLAKRENFVK